MRPKKLNSVLKEAKVRTFLVSNLKNICYLTGVDMSAGYLLITAKKNTLFVDGRYTEKAKELARKDIQIGDMEDFKKSLRNIRSCGFESEQVSVEKLSKWKRNFKNTKFVQKKGIIEEFRRSKDADEIKAFKKAQRITDKILHNIPKALQKGISEKDLAWKLECWAREYGADGLAFDPIVAFGTHSSRPHHSPTNRKLKKGDIVQIDVGAQYNGYAADKSRVFFTGKMTSLQEKVYLAVKRAKDESEKAVKPGITNQKLDRIARNILAEEGFEEYFVHSLGHGVGLDIHEGVSLSSEAKRTKLLKNEIVTIEPGVYIPGKFGIRLEDEVIV